MTGETANGRSTRPSTNVLPQNRCRARTTASARPKSVLTTVATSVIPNVSSKARRASAEANAARNGRRPPASAARSRASVGTRISTANQPRTAPVSSRRPSGEPGKISMDMGAAPPALKDVQGDQDPQRKGQQHDRDGHGGVAVVALDLTE